MITFEEFKKIDLRVAKILEAQRVEGSDKLLKLSIDIGEDPLTSSGQGQRQIIAGIGKKYEPQDLAGREIIIVANLEPRVLMGLESQGMLLAANDDGPVLLMPEREVPPGSTIQ